MRFLLFVLGLALGVASTLVYATFASPSHVPSVTPLERDPQLTVTLGESLIAEVVERSITELPGSGARPELAVALKGDTIAVTASLDVLGQRASGTATLRPTIESGKLRFDVGETTLGALQLPALEQSIQQQLDARISSLLAGMPVTFTGARVDRDGLTLTCRVSLP